MKNQVDCLFIAKRDGLLQVLYYCPRCESINEILCRQNLRALPCHDCGQVNDAGAARIEVAGDTGDETGND